MAIQHGNPLQVRCDFCHALNVLYERDSYPVGEYHGGDYRGRLICGQAFSLFCSTSCSCEEIEEFKRFISKFEQYWVQREDSRSIANMPMGLRCYYHVRQYYTIELCNNCNAMQKIRDLYIELASAVRFRDTRRVRSAMNRIKKARKRWNKERETYKRRTDKVAEAHNRRLEKIVGK